MQLGISSYTFTWAIGVPGHPPEHPLTAIGLLERAAELGVSLVQMADNLPLERASAMELDAFQKRAAELQLTIELGTRGIDLDHLKNCLSLAQRLDAKLLRVVVDTATHHPDADTVVNNVSRLAPDLEKAGIKLAIENHDRYNTHTLVEILERIQNPAVGICLDTVNSFGALEGPEVVLERLGPWVINLHLKDFVIFRASHLMGFTLEGRPAGEGQLDIPHVLEKLRERGRQPNAILELWTPPSENLTATIAKEAAWAARSLAYLRQLIPN
jgi:3-oxoisoapionate decarboxylase